ncbi:hypothetical protein T492DRAFT_896309 [Pavlovales sp. CCMP2436]|nr:hypothetical protein T492DRAFT_896309 [Pavlovales sp. CCMP2436]
MSDPPLCYLAYNYVNARYSGVVTDISAVVALAEQASVVYAKPLVKTGACIVGPEDGMPTWVADIMVSSDKPSEALQTVLALSDSLTPSLARLPRLC